MALKLPCAAELRARLRFERQKPAANIGGVVKASWDDPIVLHKDHAAKVEPTRMRPGQGEEVIAGRLTGKTMYDIWVRNTACMRALTNMDRAVNLRTGEIYNLGQPIDPDNGKRWLLIQAVSTGNAKGQG